jgi:trigger factor
MACTLEKISDNKVKLRIEVDAQTFENGIETAYRKTAKNYRAAGFRQGRAPRKVIEAQYGEGVFFEDAFKEIMPEAYEAAVRELEVDPVERPYISIESMGKNEALVFTAEVHVKPPVSLGQYKGIEVEKVEYNVSDAEVQEKVDQAREKAARYVEADRPVQKGDRVIIDYVGSIDGKTFEGGSAENATLDIGSGMFIPGFEEQIIGMSKEEEKDLTVTFPEDYPAPEYAGKAAVFHVKLHEIKEKELPEFDDEFVKDISDEFDSVEQYLDDIRKKLTEEGKKAAKAKMEESAIKQVVDNAEVNIPDCMVEDQLDSMLYDLQRNLGGSGIKLEDFFKYTGTSIEDYRERNREEAYSRVKTRLVVEALREAENIEADDASVEERLAEMAAGYKMEPEDLKNKLQPAEMGYIKDAISINKTIDMIMENIVWAEPEKAKAPKATKAAKTTKAQKAKEESAAAGEEQE